MRYILQFDAHAIYLYTVTCLVQEELNPYMFYRFILCLGMIKQLNHTIEGINEIPVPENKPFSLGFAFLCIFSFDWS